MLISDWSDERYYSLIGYYVDMKYWSLIGQKNIKLNSDWSLT